MADTNPNAYANSTHVPSPAAKHPGVLKLQSIIKGDDVQTWDQVWKLQVTPWDAGFSQPPLKEVVESGEVAFPRGGEGVSKPRVLVPGCGTERYCYCRVDFELAKSPTSPVSSAQ
ncbi:hypothetical protein AX16_006419 [Volvariella volvacea WC 439]|nr:hypothetical protein AX16_006419 [Volvariella volvacea WC 439]